MQEKASVRRAGLVGSSTPSFGKCLGGFWAELEFPFAVSGFKCS